MSVLYLNSENCVIRPVFAIKLLMVYSECNINANILFNKELKQLHVYQVQQQQQNNNQRDTEYIGSVMLQLTSNQMACSENCFEIIAYYWSYRRRISNYRKLQPHTPLVPQH